MPVDRLASKKHQRFSFEEGRRCRRWIAFRPGTHPILDENTTDSSQAIGLLGFSEKPPDTDFPEILVRHLPLDRRAAEGPVALGKLKPVLHLSLRRRYSGIMKNDLTFRMEKEQREKLRKRAAALGKSESELLRDESWIGSLMSVR